MYLHPCFLLLITILALSVSALSSEEGISKAGYTSAEPVIDLGYARYRGSTNHTSNITAFQSIRYAAPPTGLLRFQSPRAPIKVATIQNATSVPPQCYQSTIGFSPTNPLLPSFLKREIQPINTSEDCLFLNVFVPNIATARGLPVVIWIHGGGYVGGNAGMYPGYDLTSDSDNQAITVVMQYRLGAFGFLAGSEVKKHGVWNAGLLDQNFALEWAQKYISKFGGDPSKVTIWGESAGAGSVLQHVVAHDGRTNPPLFRAAITSSTFLPSQYPGDGPIPTIFYNELANLTGCLNATDTFSCLVAVDADTLGKANNEVITGAFYGTYAFVPVVDGDFIMERPTETLKKGQVNGEMLLSMTNTLEGWLFTIPNVTNITFYSKEVFPLLDTVQTTQVGEIYSALNETLSMAEDQAIAIMGESIFICPTYYLLHAFNGRSWKGEFAIPPGHHADDVWYYFTYAGQPYNNTEFIASFSGSFLDFVLSLDPNSKFDPENRTPHWGRWGSDHTEMLFNKTAGGEPVIKPFSTDPGLLERCAFWERIAAQTSQ